MNIQFSLKKLLVPVLLSTAVIIVPNISQAHERGHNNERQEHHYNRKHVNKNNNYSHHNRGHKYNKDYGHKSNKHRNNKHRSNNKSHHSKKHDRYDYGHFYSSKKQYFPRHTAALHRKGMFFYFYD